MGLSGFISSYNSSFLLHFKDFLPTFRMYQMAMKINKIFIIG